MVKKGLMMVQMWVSVWMIVAEGDDFGGCGGGGSFCSLLSLGFSLLLLLVLSMLDLCLHVLGFDQLMEL